MILKRSQIGFHKPFLPFVKSLGSDVEMAAGERNVLGLLFVEDKPLQAPFGFCGKF